MIQYLHVSLVELCDDAIDIYRHIGFKDEGILRQTVFKNGTYLDTHVLGMLRSDYNKIKQEIVYVLYICSQSLMLMGIHFLCYQ